MIKHQLFTRGEYVYALLSDAQNPEFMFPIKAIVYDTKYDDVSPLYQLRIVEFLDDIEFLKRYFFQASFKKELNATKYTRINLKRGLYKTREDLTNAVNGENWKSYLVVVDSIYCTKYEGELMELFKKLQDFMIEKRLKEIFELSSRLSYNKGQYHFKSKGLYEIALKNFLGDKLPKDPTYLDRLLYRPKSDELDKI